MIIHIDRKEVSDPRRGRLGLRCAFRDVLARTVQLETISFGGSCGVLHESLVRVGALDMASPTIKSMPQRR
ncbi:hypothetical protein GW17_00013986 [Ensete ventricosum]|nr:hypothetical protein GW17_00013986 [Ensete ventricosum]